MEADDVTTPTTASDGRPDAAARLRSAAVPAAVAVVVGVIVWLAASSAGDGRLGIGEALLLGLIEGATEYVPVSSTGHLTVAQDLMGLTETAEAERAADAYAVAIQLGAILAVLGLYRRRVSNVVLAVLRPTQADPSARRLAASLAVAFVPAGLSGLLLGDVIKERLFGPWPTVAAWAVGGVAILAWSRWGRDGSRALEDVTVRDGVVVGLAQVFALWPGVSRSLVTILGATGRGLDRSASVELSFLLGLVTLGAATVYEGSRSADLIVAEFGLVAPLVGLGAALAAAAAAVVWLVRYLERRGLAVFGWYRLALAACVTLLILGGQI